MGLRVLVIEDDEDISELLANRLRNMGCSVEFASDGEAGLKSIREKIPDLVLLDLLLPAVPGEVICKEIRDDPDEKISKIPILMITSKGSSIDVLIGKTLGADSYIKKPFDPDDLVREIKRLLKIN